MKLSFQNVSFAYPNGVQALNQISLRIESGEIVALIGENGAGKSTLARHANGLLKPSSGRVLVGEMNTKEHSTAQLARHVGYIFQNPDQQLFEQTVWKEVAFGPKNLGCSDEEVAVRTKAALAEVGLLEDADSHPYDLHASQRKLVAIAATLAMQPKIVILDEPTPGQDVEGVNRVGTITDRLASQGRTVIVISHDIDFCAEHCNRVIVMARGQILADGPTESIFSQSELLAEAEIEPPQLTRLALSLGLPRNPLSVARFLAMFAEAQKGEHP